MFSHFLLCTLRFHLRLILLFIFFLIVIGFSFSCFLLAPPPIFFSCLFYDYNIICMPFHDECTMFNATLWHIIMFKQKNLTESHQMKMHHLIIIFFVTINQQWQRDCFELFRDFRSYFWESLSVRKIITINNSWQAVPSFINVFNLYTFYTVHCAHTLMHHIPVNKFGGSIIFFIVRKIPI